MPGGEHPNVDLLDVRPLSTTHDVTDSRMHDAIVDSQHLHSNASRVTLTNLADLSFGQPRLAASLPSLLPTFGNHIGHVVGLRASHQVRGTDTAHSSTVTSVKDVRRP